MTSTGTLYLYVHFGSNADCPRRHCPSRSSHRCTCEPTTIDENFYKLVPLESSQKKPDDTCIRQFLGGPWLDKKQGWSQEGERLFGGDGYHGYTLTGLE